jgi:hypothetical protein
MATASSETIWLDSIQKFPSGLMFTWAHGTGGREWKRTRARNIEHMTDIMAMESGGDRESIRAMIDKFVAVGGGA